jgi:hypothetical protein
MSHAAIYAAVDTPLVRIGEVAVYQTSDGLIVPVASVSNHNGAQYLRAVAEPNGSITVTVQRRVVQ